MTLDVQSIDFSYTRKKVFTDFNVSFNSGINIVIGNNGSGKTTLLKMLAGVYTPKKGQIVFNNKKYDNYNDIRQFISYIPQEFDAYKEMKVRDFLSFITEIKQKQKAKYLKENIEEAMVMTDIKTFSDKKIKELSGGMRKRVGIAQALVSNSQIIIADEPTADLDPEQCELFNRVVKKIVKDKIIIISTHIIQDIHEDSDKIYVLSEGKLSFEGKKSDLLDSLKDKIFKIEKSKYNNYINNENIKMLDEIDENGELYIKVAIENIDEEIMKEFIPTKYTNADIWRYYK